MKKVFLFLLTTLFSFAAVGAEDSFSLHLNPVHAIDRTLTMEAFFPVEDHYTLGPAISLEYTDFVTTKNVAYVAGIRINKHFSKAHKTGAYIGGQLSYAYLENTKTVGAKIYKREGHDFRLTSVFGYLWRYEKFIFNVAIGGGFTSYGHPKKVTENGEEYTDTISLPDIPFLFDGDFSIGWVF